MGSFAGPRNQTDQGLQLPDSALLEYHHRSKHRLDRYAPGPGRLDWANQPDPFRRYTGAVAIKLPLAADALPTRYAALRRGELPAMQPFDIRSIAVLFELSLGLSAWKSFGGNRWALRCNPSSGNLHPTEGYLLCPNLPGLSAGVYHYVSRDHTLERRAALDSSTLVGRVREWRRRAGSEPRSTGARHGNTECGRGATASTIAGMRSRRSATPRRRSAGRRVACLGQR